MSLAARARSWLEARAARGYVTAGLEEAVGLARRLDAQRVACTVGYWDGPGAPGSDAMGAVRRALDATGGLDAIVAVKAPPLLAGSDPQMIAASLPLGGRIVVDAPGPPDADGALALALALADRGHDAGIALPGRWRRAAEDAERAVAHGLTVRLVKGEQPDPSGRGPDPGDGLVALAAQLAGRARHVAVASHDVAVASAALERLRDAHTSCELELLLGLPVQVAAVAAERGVRMRVYVPWGTRAWTTYDATAARHDPALARRLLADAIAGERRWRRTLRLRGAAAPRPQLSTVG